MTTKAQELKVHEYRMLGFSEIESTTRYVRMQRRERIVKIMRNGKVEREWKI